MQLGPPSRSRQLTSLQRTPSQLPLAHVPQPQGTQQVLQSPRAQLLHTPVQSPLPPQLQRPLPSPRAHAGLQQWLSQQQQQQQQEQQEQQQVMQGRQTQAAIPQPSLREAARRQRERPSAGPSPHPVTLPQLSGGPGAAGSPAASCDLPAAASPPHPPVSKAVPARLAGLADHASPAAAGRAPLSPPSPAAGKASPTETLSECCGCCGAQASQCCVIASSQLPLQGSAQNTCDHNTGIPTTTPQGMHVASLWCGGNERWFRGLAALCRSDY